MTLEQYVPTQVTCMAGGKEILISPLVIVQIPAFTANIYPVMERIMAGDIISVITDSGDSLIKAVSIATYESPEWIGGLNADEFLNLLTAIIEVNANFFAKRLIPMISKMNETITKTFGEMSLQLSYPEA